MSSRRIVALGVAAWLVVVTVGAGLVWAVISRAGRGSRAARSRRRRRPRTARGARRPRPLGTRRTTRPGRIERSTADLAATRPATSPRCASGGDVSLGARAAQPVAGGSRSTTPARPSPGRVRELRRAHPGAGHRRPASTGSRRSRSTSATRAEAVVLEREGGHASLKPRVNAGRCRVLPNPRLGLPGARARRPVRHRPRRARRGGRGARRRGAARPGRDGRGRRRGDGRRASTCSSRPAPAPASRWPTSSRPCCTTSRVVVATATLALQHQLVERDIPRLVEAVGDLPASTRRYAVLKGRSNYACLHRIREGVPDDQGALVDVPAGLDGREGPRAARLGRGGGRGRRQRRARHAPRGTPTASGGRSASATASASAPPSARSAPSASPSWPARRRTAPTCRHQPLAARDRRDRGRADDPRLRRRRDRRGPRARPPG